MKKRFPPKTSIAKASIALAAGALLAVAVPLAASAHVTVAPNIAAAGSYSLVTFKVPNESATAVTKTLEVDLPTDTPFSSVSYVPVAGWSVDVTTSTLRKPVTVGENKITQAVTRVIWTADAGAEIRAGQLQLFPLSLGPVPDTGKLVLKAIQTYSDGTIVSWSETGADAEHPAPILYVNDAPPTGKHAQAQPTVSATETPAPGAASASSNDVLARGLGVGGLVVGAIGIVLAVVAARRKASS